MKLTTALENFKGVVSDDLSFASVEIDKNCWLTLPRWKSLCHKLTHDQPQPGSFFQRPREAEKRDPGNEVDTLQLKSYYQKLSVKLSPSCFENKVGYNAMFFFLLC